MRLHHQIPLLIIALHISLDINWIISIIITSSRYFSNISFTALADRKLWKTRAITYFIFINLFMSTLLILFCLLLTRRIYLITSPMTTLFAVSFILRNFLSLTRFKFAHLFVRLLQKLLLLVLRSLLPIFLSFTTTCFRTRLETLILCTLIWNIGIFANSLRLLIDTAFFFHLILVTVLVLIKSFSKLLFFLFLIVANTILIQQLLNFAWSVGIIWYKTIPFVMIFAVCSLLS